MFFISHVSLGCLGSGGWFSNGVFYWLSVRCKQAGAGII